MSISEFLGKATIAVLEKGILAVAVVIAVQIYQDANAVQKRAASIAETRTELLVKHRDSLIAAVEGILLISDKARLSPNELDTSDKQLLNDYVRDICISQSIVHALQGKEPSSAKGLADKAEAVRTSILFSTLAETLEEQNREMLAEFANTIAVFQTAIVDTIYEENDFVGWKFVRPQ